LILENLMPRTARNIVEEALGPQRAVDGKLFLMNHLL
jgi:hypothetical protein